MMRRLLPLALVALAACSQSAEQQESADDFAARIGQDGSQQLDPSQPDPNAPNTAQPAPPANVDLTALQQLGDVGGVNLGPRDGGCTLMVGEQELLIAAAMNDKALPGKAVVRIGNALVMTDAAIGGLEAVRRGTTFAGEGFKVTVRPAEGDAQRRPANVIVSDASGKSQTYSGTWICA